MHRRHTSLSSPVASTSALTPPSAPLTRRPRAYSYHPASQAKSRYGASLLEVLDLSKSTTSALWSLSDYLRGRLDEAEEDIKALKKAYVSESESEASTSGGEEWEVVTRSKSRKGKARDRPTSSRSSSVGSSSSSCRNTTASDDSSALEHFISTATNFLTAIRAELPSLTQLPSTSPVQFQLSPDARIALDTFLTDHPLPSLPQLHLLERIGDSKKSATSSASALYSRVSAELAGLQEILTHLANIEPKAAYVASYIPSLPGLSSLPTLSSPPLPLHTLRDYFASESERLSASIQTIYDSGPVHSLRSLGTETTASIARLAEEASELTTLLTTTSSAAFDEAARIYHAALEGGRKRLLAYEELPFEWRNNPHIKEGYRYIPIDRWRFLLRSAFEIHNETINIHSHFVGFLSLVYLLIFRLPESPHNLPHSHWADTAIAVFFIGAAMECLLCSAAWHLMSGCATRCWHSGAACVDYVGISALIAASVMGMEYYGFYCRPDLAIAYMSFSAALGITGMILPWKPWFNERKYKMWRIGFFLGLAVSATMPMFHASFLFGFGQTLQFFAPSLPSIMAYLVGLTAYAFQWPECGGSGRFDYLFASHQLWHFAIVVAVWMQWRAMTIWASGIHLVPGQDLLSCALR